MRVEPSVVVSQRVDTDEETYAVRVLVPAFGIAAGDFAILTPIYAVPRRLRSGDILHVEIDGEPRLSLVEMRNRQLHLRTPDGVVAWSPGSSIRIEGLLAGSVRHHPIAI
jgi:hypothetical protein